MTITDHLSELKASLAAEISRLEEIEAHLSRQLRQVQETRRNFQRQHVGLCAAFQLPLEGTDVDRGAEAELPGPSVQQIAHKLKPASKEVS